MAKKTPTPDGKDANSTRNLGPSKPKDDSEPPANPYPFLLPAAGPGEIGRVGHYRVLHLLGAGGMGMVFAAEDIALRRYVAIKVMHPDLAADPSSGLQRFLREARALGGVKHQNLVTVYQAFQDRGTVFLVMELLQGESLDSRIHGLEPIELPEILQIGHEIAEGLAALHEHGLIHRDIKPANIWLETKVKGGKGNAEQKATFQVKILDLGLVRSVDEEKGLTATGMVMGTPAYMSLEQVRGQQLDHRTDLFSLGCVLYAMCTGYPPFMADDPITQAALLVAGSPTPVYELNPAIPKPLSDLITKLVAKKPADRPASAIEVAECLRNLPTTATTQPIPTPPPRRTETAPKPKSSGQTEAIYKPEPAPSVARKTVPIVPEPETEISPASGKSSRRPKKSKAKKKASFWKKHGLTLLASLWLVVAALLVIAVLGRGDKSATKSTEPDSPTKPPDKTPVKTATGEVVYLSDFPTSKVKFGFAPPLLPGFDGIVRVQGRNYPHGVFMHPAPNHDVSQNTYTLGKQFTRFNAEVTFNDTGDPNPSPLRFAVLVDGKQKWQSGMVRRGSPPQACDVDVRGADSLSLEVVADGDERGAHGAWLDARLTK
ncbi:MAG: protein kinase [Gemmataceae bacterium]